MTLYLLNYNNYYNRIVKRKETVAEYLDSANDYAGPFNGVNFVPGDGVSTSHVLNHPDDTRWDYLLAVDSTTNEIVSRWFIIDETRTSGGQWRINLYRDLIAEWYNEIVDAPVFIEKATLTAADPAIFNSEQMTFNQIKKSETLLWDRSKVAWIVGYMNKKLEGDKVISIPVETPSIQGEASSTSDFPFFGRQGERLYINPEEAIISPVVRFQGTGGYYAVGWNSNNEIITPYPAYTRLIGEGIVEVDVPDASAQTVIQGNVPSSANSIARYLAANNPEWNITSTLGFLTASETSTLLGLNGAIYRLTGEDKYYKVIVEETEIAEATTKYISSTSALGVQIGQVLRGSYSVLSTPTQYRIQMPLTYYKVKYEEFPVAAASFTIADNRQETVDAPYDVFAMPFGTITYNNTDTLSGDICYKIAQKMVTQLTSSNIYDIQLLPYCPFSDNIFRGGTIRDINPLKLDNTVHTQYQLITTTDNKNVGIILYCGRATFSKTITNAQIFKKTNALDIKVANECDKYRLCSPNYNGQFEFSAVQNGGVSEWNIDCTYKPFQPYIHIAPNFGLLYGRDFDDARGLVCGGDFSLPQISSNWESYQIQNKNFQNQFDRQIENMEVQNKYSRISEIGNIVTGALQAGTATGITGRMMGGVAGAGIGAGIGGAASLGGGLVDLYINDKLRGEALDYTQDQFNYQLGNIKALPYSLTKVGAYNANNKLVPFVEYYSCTDTEKQALRDKLYYNGMSVGRIGKISEFQQEEPTYIKGKLIRLENTGDDYHIINAISAEINKGVFI